MKFKAFSLIELMISLIAISVITAAFTPVISKKLKTNDIAIVATDSNCTGYDTQCTEAGIGQGCVMCDTCNPICKVCLKECDDEDNKGINKDSCSCIDDCTDTSIGGIENCSKCEFFQNEFTCKACTEGHYVDNNECRECIDGTTSDHSNPKKCTCVENCNSCNADGSCKPDGCISNKYEYNDETRTCERKIDLAFVNGTLWTAKNAGDEFGPEIPDNVVKCYVDQTCNVNKTDGTCWLATDSKYTARNCDSKGGYDGCNRTVCNWYAANTICKVAGFSLPTEDQLKQLRQTPQSSSKYIKYEVNLCSSSTPSDNYARCDYSSSGCQNAYLNYCKPHYVWGVSKNNSSAYSYYVSYNNLYSDYNVKEYAYSVRCVKNCSDFDENCAECSNKKCTSCKAGYYLNTNGRCIACLQGTWAPQGSTSCQVCEQPECCRPNTGLCCIPSGDAELASSISDCCSGCMIQSTGQCIECKPTGEVVKSRDECASHNTYERDWSGCYSDDDGWFAQHGYPSCTHHNYDSSCIGSRPYVEWDTYCVINSPGVWLEGTEDVCY